MPQNQSINTNGSPCREMLLTKAGRGYNTKYLISRIVTTTRKRSLGQGNVFMGVCLSTERRGMPTGGSASRGVYLGFCIQWGSAWGVCIQGVCQVWAEPPPRTRKASSTHPTGMLSCSRINLICYKFCNFARIVLERRNFV